jgi:NADPH:quinone reductase-like Zn-dependent oxidoreductase
VEIKAPIDLSSPVADKLAVQSFDGDAFGDGAVLGCDFAGVVEQVGSEVSRLKVGDKIAALIWGGLLVRFW